MATATIGKEASGGEPTGAACESTAARRQLEGIAAMCGTGLSSQLGAAIGSLAFPAIGPIGVVAVRQYIAALVLLPLGRPRIRSFRWAQWWPCLLLAGTYGAMNLSLYTAIDRIGLGLAVTLEFLGPLSIALAGSRRRIDLGCAVLALLGVVALMRPTPTTDYLGMGLGLVAACCWACYILLNHVIGRRLPGAEGSAVASTLSALMFLPIGVVVALRTPPSVPVLLCAVAAGVLSSAVPFLVDVFSLRRVATSAFGLFMSINPLLAAVIGSILLRQWLGWIEWISIGAIVSANAVSIATRTRRAPATRSRAGEGAVPPVRS